MRGKSACDSKRRHDRSASPKTMLAEQELKRRIAFIVSACSVKRRSAEAALNLKRKSDLKESSVRRNQPASVSKRKNCSAEPIWRCKRVPVLTSSELKKVLGWTDFVRKKKLDFAALRKKKSSARSKKKRTVNARKLLTRNARRKKKRGFFARRVPLMKRRVDLRLRGLVKNLNLKRNA